MTLEDNELKLIGGNEGDLNGSPSPSSLSPADWSATGGRRRRKSRGMKSKKSKGGMNKKTMGGKGTRRTGKKGKKSGKSRKSKSRRR